MQDVTRAVATVEDLEFWDRSCRDGYLELAAAVRLDQLATRPRLESDAGDLAAYHAIYVEDRAERALRSEARVARLAAVCLELGFDR